MVCGSVKEDSCYIIYVNIVIKIFMVIHLDEFCGRLISYLWSQGMIQEKNKRFVKSQKGPRVENFKCLLSSTNEVAQSPSILLSNEEGMRSKLKRKVKSSGILDTLDLDDDERNYVLQKMENVPSSLVSDSGVKHLIVDCGASTHATFDESDFVEGSLEPLEDPLYMDGIAGMVPATHKGLVHYEVVTDCGDKEVIEDWGYLMPALPCRLFSPQGYLRTLGAVLDDPDQSYLMLRHNRAELVLKGGNRITVLYDPTTHLPILSVYSDVQKAASALKSFKGGVIDEDNQNLSTMQKELLKWHYRLGHLGMQHVQWLGRQGLLDNLGKRWGSTTVKAPKCAACLLGKQKRKSTPGVKQTKTGEGNLKRNMLEPGDLIFSDQYESREEGKVFTYRGATLQSESFKGGTIFCDASSCFWMFIIKPVLQLKRQSCLS